MLFECLKQDAPQKRSFINKAHPSKGDCRRICCKHGISVKTKSATDVLLMIYEKFSEQEFLRNRQIILIRFDAFNGQLVT